MTEDFPTLIGKFIHHCGSLEFFINNSIRSYATDLLLSNDAIKSSLYKRIVLLRQLLHERSKIKKEDIDSLCDELHKIREQRNMIAHNPIVSTKPNGSGTERILANRNKTAGVTSSVEITMADVAEFVVQTGQLITRFSKLIPAATGTY